uniref:Uncharacterized protein n=1 Tax=Panagrolaimus superbus TaxID=310955 RepID=A0A914Z1E2_9BILA
MYFTITNAPIQFLYRYLLLCWDIKLGIFGFLGLIAISVLGISYFCYIWIDAILSRGIKDELFYSSLLNGTDWIIDGKIPNYGAFPFREKIFGSGWISIVIISVSYGIVWFCAISIFMKLKKIKTLYNRKAMQHQGQISIVLIVESLTPFVTVVIPLSMDIIILILDVYLFWAGQAVTLISSFSPPVNAIVKLTVISCYRKAIAAALSPIIKKTPFTISENNKSATPKLSLFNHNGIKPIDILYSRA